MNKDATAENCNHTSNQKRGRSGYLSANEFRVWPNKCQHEFKICMQRE